jgi:hypothetical protein
MSLRFTTSVTSTPGEGQQILDDGRGLLAGLLDLEQRGLEETLLGAIEQQHVRVPHDAAQDVVQVVRDAPGQNAERLHPLGPRQLVLDHPSLPLGDNLLRDVEQHRVVPGPPVLLVEEQRERRVQVAGRAALGGDREVVEAADRLVVGDPPGAADQLAEVAAPGKLLDSPLFQLRAAETGDPAQRVVEEGRPSERSTSM